MSRWKAAGLHLSISIVVAAIASGLLLGIWYPPPYFHAGGAGKLLALVVGVDVSIGPLLTLLVFKHGKRGLKLDLSVIGVLQATALVYGFHVLVISRPVFMVAAVDRFVIVAAEDIAPADLAKASDPAWRHLSWTGPVLVGATVPTNPKQREKLMFSSLQGGKDIQDLPQYYVPYSGLAEKMVARAHPVALLRKMHPDAAHEISRWLKSHHLAPDRAVWLPIQARRWDMAMMLNKVTGQPIGPIPLDPWQHATAAE
ncbi:MAG: TfpX/TfpZ family type IV pilin accessory protein [Rhodanobacteraceae bacterium]